jgi:chitin synthase
MLRTPSMKGNTQVQNQKAKSNFEDAKSAVDALIEATRNTRKWNVFCIKAMDESGKPNRDIVSSQLDLFNLRQYARFRANYNLDVLDGQSYDQVMTNFGPLIATANVVRGSGLPAIDQVKQFVSNQWWPARDILFGGSKLFLSLNRWRWLETALERLKLKNDEGVDSPISSGTSASGESGVYRGSFYRDDDTFSEAESANESEYRYLDDTRRASKFVKNETFDIEMGSPKKSAPIPGEKQEIIEKTEELTCSRKCWVCCTWALTWWIPSPCLSWCGGMKRPDIRMAWREKVALCVIIFMLCASLLFFIVGLRYVICPPIAVKTLDEVRAESFARVGTARKPYFAAYGRYYLAEELMSSHKKDYGQGSGPGAVDDYLFEEYYGEDVSNLFYKADAWEFYCPGLPRPPNSWDNLDESLSWQRRGKRQPKFDFIHRNNAPSGVPQLYADNLLKYAVGRVGWSLITLKKLSSTTQVIFTNGSRMLYCLIMFIILP